MGFVKTAITLGLAAFFTMSYAQEKPVLDNSFSSLNPKIQLELRLEKEPKGQNGKPDKYAALFLGTNEDRFTYNLSLIYQVLLESGFPKDNIYILDQHGEENFIYPSDGIATKENILKVLAHLASKVDSLDECVVHVDGHGSVVEHHVQRRGLPDLVLSSDAVVVPTMKMGRYLNGEWIVKSNYLDPNRYLTDAELEDAIKNPDTGIRPKIGIFTTDICFGGEMAKDIGTGRWIAVSQAANEAGYKLPRNSLCAFFYGALRNPGQADANKDGKVSVYEAFEYAKSRHTWTQMHVSHPQIYSDSSAIDYRNVTIK